MNLTEPYIQDYIIYRLYNLLFILDFIPNLRTHLPPPPPRTNQLKKKTTTQKQYGTTDTEF